VDEPPRTPVQTLGIALLVFAAVLAVTGALLLFGGRLGLGSLPGDIRLSGENWSCFVPITTSIVISLILTLIFNLWARWHR
jgi:hypothetical protein